MVQRYHRKKLEASMSPEQKRTWEIVVGAVVGLASVGVTLLAYDAQMDGAILGDLRPRMRWAWQCAVAAVVSAWHRPTLIGGAERACEQSPWRPTWRNLP
jgi:hypothetical protein